MLYTMASGLIFIKKQNKNTAMLSMLDIVLPKWQKKKKKITSLGDGFDVSISCLKQRTSKNFCSQSHSPQMHNLSPPPPPAEEASLCLLYSKPLESWGPWLSQLLLYSQCQVQYTLAYLTFKNLFKSTLRHLLVGYKELLNFPNNGTIRLKK